MDESPYRYALTIRALMPSGEHSIAIMLIREHQSCQAVIDETMAIPGNAHLTDWTFEIVEIEESIHD